ncbi:hypothetical protein ABNF97_16450 [Plantactinospora sp. B6F1]|uniref:hypothetical protein n=1 Tax=Plantactinospora sp. B6F1 TaxID=3158971 RepID=UPI0032D9227D
MSSHRPSRRLEAAKREIINAGENSKQEILNHIDAVAAPDVEACTQAAVTKFAQIDSMPGSLLGPFINGPSTAHTSPAPTSTPCKASRRLTTSASSWELSTRSR